MRPRGRRTAALSTEALVLQQEHARRLDERLVVEEPMRPLLVGQAPGRGLEGWPALTGAAGDRIARLAGLAGDGFRPAMALMLNTERANLLSRWPGRAAGPGGGDLFPLPEARAAAQALCRRLFLEGRLYGRAVVLFGRGVATAFGVGADAPLVGWASVGMTLHDLAGEDRWVAFPAALCPHPSGRSRFWNAPVDRERAAALLREAIGGAR